LDAAVDRFGAQQLPGAPQLRADAHRRRKADLVAAVVDAQPRAVNPHNLRQEEIDERKGEKAVRDTRAERAVPCAFGIDMDPLMIERRIGEPVDARLIDDHPRAFAKAPTGSGNQFIRMGEHARGCCDLRLALRLALLRVSNEAFHHAC
jgi:hypothetical protein